MPVHSMPGLHLERVLLYQGARVVAGVDEVGRGSWAGPVVAAAVVLPLSDPARLAALEDARDSKLLSPDQRLALFDTILSEADSVGVGWASHHAIDRTGLGPANRRAMLRAVAALASPPDALLLDAVRLPECKLPQLFLPKSDAVSLSVACASIAAKVVRDRWMQRCDARFPGYGFAEHKGYGTPRHQEALRALGPSPLHRRSFSPVALAAP